MFGGEERLLLAPQMSPRESTVCRDETFHPQTFMGGYRFQLMTVRPTQRATIQTQGREPSRRAIITTTQVTFVAQVFVREAGVTKCSFGTATSAHRSRPPPPVGGKWVLTRVGYFSSPQTSRQIYLRCCRQCVERHSLKRSYHARAAGGHGQS